MTGNSVLDFIITISGLASAVGAILKFGQTWIVRPLANEIDERIETKLRPLRDDLAHVRREVSVDSGQSLKDVVNQTSRDVAVLTGRFEEHLRQSGGTP